MTDIPGYEGLYCINMSGDVFAPPRTWRSGKGNTRHHDGLWITARLDHKGYPRLVLTRDGRSKQWLVHRLVAIAFLPNPLNKPQVNHMDGNPANPRVGNLEWATAAENSQHAYRTGLHVARFGDDAPTNILTSSQVRIIKGLLAQGVRPIDIAHISGLARKNIYNVKEGVAWKETSTPDRHVCLHEARDFGVQASDS